MTPYAMKVMADDEDPQDGRFLHFADNDAYQRYLAQRAKDV